MSKILKRYFHATRIQNVESIKREGLIPKFGEVYLTDSLDSALKWMGFRFQAMGDELMAIIEVEANPNSLVEGTDHSPLMQKLFGCGKSLVSHQKIPKSRIKKIHYYSIVRPTLKPE